MTGIEELKKRAQDALDTLPEGQGNFILGYILGATEQEALDTDKWVEKHIEEKWNVPYELGKNYESGFLKGKTIAKKSFVETACVWLRNEIYGAEFYLMDQVEKLIFDFRKAMNDKIIMIADKED